MATAEYWAESVIVREQRTMFAPTLDDMIDEDHEVRLLDEALRKLDWTEWEAVYSRERGQPPIHPRVIAGLWLYGMMRRIRTSRFLEYACRHNIDFIWLAEGHTPDHSKLAEFFSVNKAPLKSLFKQVCKMAMRLGLVRLGTVAFDATRVKSANSRFNTLTAVDRVTEMFGEKPETMLTDGGNAAGSVLAGLEQREITAFAPAESSAPAADSPVLREDLTQPVPEELWPKLKLNDKKRLDKSCFVYDAEQDHYVCPMGRVLERKDSDTRNGVLTVRYESLDCSGCPLAAKCLMKSENPDACRQVRRDEHEDVRQRTAARMATEAGREIYDKRSPIAETPFGYLKGFLGHRQFLRKGVEACDTEWRWSCLSLNMKKLVRYIRRIRQELEELPDAAPDSVERSEKCPAGA